MSPGRNSSTLRSVEAWGVSVSDVSDCFLCDRASDETDVDPDPARGSPLGTTPLGDIDDRVPDDSDDDPLNCDDPVDARTDVDDVDEEPLLESVDGEESVDDELVDDDSAPDSPAGSADATPCAATTAAPIPNATASRPIRPTCAPAPMRAIHTLDASRPYAS